MEPGHGLIDVYADPIGLLHDAGPDHPESPERLDAIITRLTHPDVSALIRNVERAAVASDEDILAVHTPEHLSLVKRAVSVGDIWIDADTHVGPRSLDAARGAAGQALAAAREACRSGRSAFCALRPPGHHATPDIPMGFCLFNNVAIAAARCLDEGLTEQVVIVDWDVHHGNGTQAVFDESDQVFFLSVHQSPLYPGSGMEADRGRGPGEGRMINIPVAAGTAGEVMRSAVTHVAVPAIATLAPKVILVSAGFDADGRDPLASLEYVADDYRKAAAALVLAAAGVGAGVVCCLEGGYDPAALAEDVAATIEGMSAPAPDDVRVVKQVERALGRCLIGHP